MRLSAPQDGVQRIEAYFAGHAYTPHRHDTYAIGYTLGGVQCFRYRGSETSSLPGRIMVIHPDEVHDGHAGTEDGFLYRMLYVEPSRIRAALDGRADTLPFAKETVFGDARLLSTLAAACGDLERPIDPLLMDQIIATIADRLLAHDPSLKQQRRQRIDSRAMSRVEAFLEANATRTVHSEELEDLAQIDRYSLARQFRRAYGTSPYRFLMMRRLDRARQAISEGTPLAETAALLGFSDQAHMSRHFNAAFGLSPGRWRRLTSAAQAL